VVVIGIEQDGQIVGARSSSRPDQPAADLPRLAIVEPPPDVERVVADEDPDLGALRDRLPLVGVALRELVRRLRLGPGRLVQPAVHLDSLVDLERPRGSGERRHGFMTIVVSDAVRARARPRARPEKGSRASLPSFGKEAGRRETQAAPSRALYVVR